MSESQFICSRSAPGRLVAQPARRALFVLLLLALSGGAQNGPLQGQGAVGQHNVVLFPDADDRDPVDQERQLRALNAERQKSMVSDTNKLLNLVTELNAEVSNANSDTLSSDQLRKLAEIEKLAHSVKDKMSTSLRGVPAYQPPTAPPFR